VEFKSGLDKLSWQVQIGLFVALAAAAAGVFWYAYASSVREGLDARQTQLVGLQADVARGLATAGRLPEFRAEVADLEDQLDRLRAVLPEERDVADLLRRVQAMATESRLTIRGFRPRAMTRRELHAEWPIGLQLEGTYHDLGAFLERVSRFPRIINVGELRISGQDGAAAAETNGTITAELTAMTFVLVDASPAAAPTE
jgi:type IV pilus assembly protein PilO